ncbi:hypothetical protein, partial [Amphritea atlantica]
MSDGQLNRQQQLVKEYLDALLKDDHNLNSIEAELDLAQEEAIEADMSEVPLVAAQLPKAGPEMEDIGLDELEITLDMQIESLDTVQPEPEP